MFAGPKFGPKVKEENAKAIMTASELVLVDFSGWLEYITGNEKADAFGAVFQGSAQVLVPTIVLYEVFQILLLRASKTDANLFLSEALRRRVVDLTGTIALAAASLSSIDYKLPMADAIIYETAQAHQAELITSDAHFSGLPGLRCFRPRLYLTPTCSRFVCAP